MRSFYLQDGTIAVSGTARTESFVRIWAGIGWPDREPGYLCVVGERTDGRYHALWEKSGGLWELGDTAVEAKDRLLLETIWIDGRDRIATSYLRNVEGLCLYEAQTDGDTCYLAIRRPVADDRPTATVVPVPDRFTANYRSALEKVRGLILRKDLLIHRKNCPKLGYTLRQPLEDLLRSPVMKGLVWVLSALDEKKGPNGLDTEPAEPWYNNVPRGR